MSGKPFLIYRSSAGSGKTYTLTLSYLKMALADTRVFQHILGVTFTNKATAEMKTRIISVLDTLAKGGEHPMKSELCRSLGTDDAGLAHKSKVLLSQILHRYGRFAVSTIDSFFHQVVRHFAREIGIQGGFALNLDSDKVLEEVIDNMLADVGGEDKKQLRDWLTRFAMSRVEEGKNWDFRGAMYTLGKELFKEGFRENSETLLALKPDVFAGVHDDLFKLTRSFETQIQRIAGEGERLIDKQGGYGEFTGGLKGPAGLFAKVLKSEYKISDKRRQARGNAEAWLTKKAFGQGILIKPLEEEILPKYDELLDFMDQGLTAYQSARYVQKHLYTLGLLSEINRYLLAYREENDTILLADLTLFLREIIRDSDTPYVYEKTGTRFHHFLLDEFQDTSGFQWDNFRPLIQNAVASGQTSLVVGDVKQSIYRWRGGDWRLLQSRVKADMDAFAEVRRLGDNYRSAHPIVAFNNLCYRQLIHIHDRFFPDLEDQYRYLLDQIGEVYQDISQEPRSGHKDGLVDIRFLEGQDNPEEEVLAQLISQVEELQRKGFAVRDMAVLVRTGKEGKVVADAFFEYRQSDQADPNLSYEVVSAESLFLNAHPVVGFLIAMLGWLQDENDDILLAEWLTCYSRLTGGELPCDIGSWRRLVPEAFVKHKEYIKTLPVTEIVESLIRFFELGRFRESYAYLQGFQDAILDFSRQEKGDIATFLNWWDTKAGSRSIQVSDDNQAIRILTVHKAKGLEFPIVFLPFLNWSINKNNQILWCKPPDKSPYNRLPVIPLEYTQALKETYWSDEYWSERMSTYLDAINPLYVATTRPVLALYAWVPSLSNKGSSKHVGDVMYRILETEEAFDQQKGRYLTGRLPHPPGRSGVNVREITLANYSSVPWRGRVSLQLRNKRLADGAISPDPLDPRQHGILLHELIGAVHTIEDLAAHRDHPLYKELSDLLLHEEVRPFFEKIDQVRTEPSILLPGGEMKRLDRLVCKEGTWHVLDFKTGKARPEDHQQVSGYMGILKQMGLERLQGRLIYLEPVKVEEVRL